MEESSSYQGLARLLEEKAPSLIKMIEEYEQKMSLKSSTKIVILAEDEKDGKELSNYLIGKGFTKITSYIPSSDDNRMVPCDLVIFHRSSIIKEYEHISNEYITKYIRSFWRDQSQFYYGPYNKELDTRMAKVEFANYLGKLEGNIMDLLMDLDEKRKLKSA